MQQKEAKDLIISAVVLAFVFAYSGIGRLESVVWNFPSALLIISLGFILHELGHRYFAKKYGCHAEFRIWKQGLIFALLIALITNGSFIFAAPGAVVIHPKIDLWGNRKTLTKKKMGIISAAGPSINFILSALFILLNIIYPLSIFSFAAFINAWLALFNMIPFPPFDGSKIFQWNKRIWILITALTFSVIILPGLL